MGCPGGTRSVSTRKRELHFVFLGKKAISSTSKHGTTIFFPIRIFFSENLEKNCPEKRA